MSANVHARLSTGNAQMDSILHGGFPENSINIIMGQPGAGKTVFAEQLLFHHASEKDRPVLYFTTLSEPLAKVLTYLQRFSFYDDEKVGSCIRYEDLGPQLVKTGLTVLQERITEAIHTIAPKIIVVDSFKALHEVSGSASEMRIMLNGLTSLLTAYETTVFLVGEYTDEDARVLPEFAIADGIIQFLRNPLSTRDERFVRVLKLRGSGYSEGLHGFIITKHGLEMFPRLVSPKVPASYEIQDSRVGTGIPGLDPLMAGGLIAGRSLLLLGPSGAGKTTAALQFVMEGVRNGEQSLYINFQENPTQLARTISALGGNAEELQGKGLHLLYMSPVELQIDSIIVTIFNLIQNHSIKRLAIDAVGDLTQSAADVNRSHDYLYALNQQLSVSGVTSMFTFEVPQGSETMKGKDERFSHMSDAVVMIDRDTRSKIKRTLTVLKQRASAHQLGVYELSIDAKGMSVGQTSIV